MSSGKKKPKKVALLGCGYIGFAFAKEALQKGFQICALTHNSEKVAALKNLGVQNVIKAELESESWHSRIDPEQDWVLNTVSAAKGINGAQRSYLEGQKSVVKWICGGKIDTFIYTSSTSVYPQNNGVWVNEKSQTDGGNERSKVLLEAEKVIQESGLGSCKRWFILRLAGIYGPGRHYILDRLRRGEVEFEGSGDFALNLAHRDDICSALWATFESPYIINNEIFNVCDDYPTLKKEMVGWLAKKIDCPSPEFNPYLTTGRSRQRQLPNGHLPNRYISNKKIREIFHWEPQYASFRSGYASILDAP